MQWRGVVGKSIQSVELSYGVGDAVIGINPAYDTPNAVVRLLEATDQVIREMGIDACYTNHMKADQNDLENMAFLLSCAGNCKKR